MNDIELLEKIYRGNPSENWHWVISTSGKRLVAFGSYNTIEEAKDIITTKLKYGIVVHLAIKGNREAIEEIRWRIDWAKQILATI